MFMFFRERYNGATFFGRRTQSAIPDVLRNAADLCRGWDVYARRRRLYGCAAPVNRDAVTHTDARAV